MFVLFSFDCDSLFFFSYVLKCAENGEPIQVLRYKNGEKYEPHFDYFNDKQNQLIGGQRIATVLMYLSHMSRWAERPSSQIQR
jgi:hypothetical protein